MRNLWDIQIRFDDDGGWRSRRLMTDEVLLGANTEAKLRLPNFKDSSLYRLYADGKKIQLESGKSRKKIPLGEQKNGTVSFTIEKTEFRVRLIADERRSQRFEPETWVASFDRYEDNSYSLWHISEGALVGSHFMSADGNSIHLKCGYEIIWKPKEDPKHLALREHNQDVHSVEVTSGRAGALRAKYGDEIFIITKVPHRDLIAQLDKPLTPEKEEGPPKKVLIGMIATWLLIMSALQLVPESKKELPLEELSPEMAKIVLEKPKEQGGNGMAGGGGIDTEHYDLKGGAGLAALDNLVKDKAKPMGENKGVLSALSALDKGVKTGKYNTAGLMPSAAGQKMLGSAQGVLGALSKIQGVASNGSAGIGGVGTKGFGGGGGGGNGKGFGTAVGNGLGKGDGSRNVIFESDKSVIRGGLDRQEVDAVVQENLSQIRFCYNRGLRANPTMQGKVISYFTIGADGSVKASRMKESTISSPEVEECIKSRVALWKFPKPRGGGEVTVNYPFLLKSN